MASLESHHLFSSTIRSILHAEEKRNSAGGLLFVIRWSNQTYCIFHLGVLSSLLYHIQSLFYFTVHLTGSSSKARRVLFIWIGCPPLPSSGESFFDEAAITALFLQNICKSVILNRNYVFYDFSDYNTNERTDEFCSLVLCFIHIRHKVISRQRHCRYAWGMRTGRH